jgi:hypothetical protein
LVRCGAVRCGVVWCGVVCVYHILQTVGRGSSPNPCLSCGVVWCGVVWCGVMSVVCYGMV